MSEKLVLCAKLGKELPALNKPPFEGVLGLEIQEKVSAEAWQMWIDDMMIKVINEYRLDLSDDKQYEILMTQMKAFIGLEKTEKVLEVENSERGRK